MILQRLRRALERLQMLPERVDRLVEDVDSLRLALGRLESRRVRGSTFERLAAAEFTVFSQFGQDGIIQYLLGKVPIPNTSFVELGVQDYRESNTRFLLCNDNWSGVIIDAADAHGKFLSARGLDWKYSIDAVTAFITRENVDDILRRAGVTGDVGLLSIDLDGNDYWIFEAIQAVAPRIVVCEYNSAFGPERAVAIPYDPGFVRARAHWSNVYYGASLPALVRLASRKGYAFVGSTSAGNDAFFVRRDVLGSIPECGAAEGWVRSRFRDTRDARGALTPLSDHAARLRLVSDLPVIDLESGVERSIRAVFGL